MSNFFRQVKEGFALGRRLSAIAAEHEHSRNLPELLRAELARDERERKAKVVQVGVDRSDEGHSKAA
ncbi:MAG: hypothetical protein HY900_26665 [Deltaproteobacteria bacterium]|nr:hypothetical protein [Deltaproteobacteria bacterium]